MSEQKKPQAGDIQAGDIFEWDGTQMIRRDDLRSKLMARWMIEDDNQVSITMQSVAELCETVESPDDWVIQDRIDPRINIDQVRWSHMPEGMWVNPVGSWVGERHGFRDDADGSVLSVRCRRKNLPPLPETPVDIPQQQRPEGPITRMIKETAECMESMRCGDVSEHHVQQFIEPDNRTPNDPLNWPHSSQKTRTTVRLFSRTFDGVVYSTDEAGGNRREDPEIRHDGYRFYVESD